MAANYQFPNVSSAYGEAMAAVNLDVNLDDTDRQLSGELMRMMINGPERPSAAVKVEPAQAGCMYDVRQLVHAEHQSFFNFAPQSLPSNSLDTDDVSLPNAAMPFAQTIQTPPQPGSKTIPSYNIVQGHDGFDARFVEQQHGEEQYALDSKRRYEVNFIPETDREGHQQWLQQRSTSRQEVMQPLEEEEISYTPEVDEQGDCILHIASQVTDIVLLTEIFAQVTESKVVSQCINILNKQKQTPLFCAVQARNLPLIKWLLDNGADPNIQGTLYVDRDEYIWRSPLHLALMAGDEYLDVLHLLLDYIPRLDINQLSLADKLTPLHVALRTHQQRQSCYSSILQLINRGADFTIREQASSKTPIMMAIETYDLDLVQSILNCFPAEKGRVILQQRTRSGDSCLHVAAGLSKIDSKLKERLLRLLVTCGANGEMPNNAKELPRDYARREWDNIRNF